MGEMSEMYLGGMGANERLWRGIENPNFEDISYDENINDEEPKYFPLLNDVPIFFPDLKNED